MHSNIRDVFRTQSGLRTLFTATLTPFGLLSGILQLILALWPDFQNAGPEILGMLAAVSLSIGIYIACSRLTVDSTFKHPDFMVTVKVGDIFNQSGNIVVGFTDTFDVDVSDGRVIHPSSIQAQFQSRAYNGDINQINSDLDAALASIAISHRENRADKPRGKLERYEIGTVIPISKDGRIYYAAAYGFMQNDLRVNCSLDAIWRTLSSIWDTARTTGSLVDLSIPIVGSELARVGSLDRQAMIKIIALSFVSSSRISVITRRLTIVVHPKDRHLVNLIEIGRFLDSLI